MKIKIIAHPKGIAQTLTTIITKTKKVLTKTITEIKRKTLAITKIRAITQTIAKTQ